MSPPKLNPLSAPTTKKGVKEEGIELPSVAFVCFWDRLVTTTTPLELEEEELRKPLFILSLAATNEGRKITRRTL